VRQREKISGESAKAEARRRQQQALAPKPDDPAKPAAVDPLVSTQFEEFSGHDAGGKLVSLSGLSGRVTVVTFWSPKNGGNQGALTALGPLYNQFHKSGLKAVGISMDPNPGHIVEALDDVTTNFPQVADQSGLATRYHVDPRAGKTFVLDASHRIVAAGPMGQDIVKAVQRLLAAPENQ
jgi:peroxiredoxin